MKKYFILLSVTFLLTLASSINAAPSGAVLPNSIRPVQQSSYNQLVNDNCLQALFRLVQSYECKSSDEIYAEKYAELVCRCKELTPSNPFTQGFRSTPLCSAKFSECVAILTPHAQNAINECKSANPSPVESLGCRIFDPDDVIVDQAAYNAVTQTRQACY